MDNYTRTFDEKMFPSMMISFAIYAGAGSTAFVSNLLFFASIWRHHILRARKEYLILSALVLLDLFQGHAYATAGFARMFYIWSGTANHLITRMGCLAKTWNWVWVTISEAYGGTLLMLSIDRLLSMGVPLHYLKWGCTYAFAMVAVAIVPYIPVQTYVIYEAQKDDDRAYLSQICYSTMVYKDMAFNKLLKATRGNLAFASFVAYIGVVLLYRLRAKRVMATMSSSTQRNRLESQRHLMVTLGFSCAATFVLYVLPSMVLSVVGINSFVYSLTGPCFAFNHMVNPLLFFWRHKTIRKAIHCLLINKKLTQNMIDALFKKGKKIGPSGKNGTSAKAEPTKTNAYGTVG